MKQPTILADFVTAAARLRGGLPARRPALEAERARAVAELERIGRELEAKRAAALAWLGDRWILHARHAPKRSTPRPVRLGRARSAGALS